MDPVQPSWHAAVSGSSTMWQCGHDRLAHPCAGGRRCAAADMSLPVGPSASSVTSRSPSSLHACTCSSIPVFPTSSAHDWSEVGPMHQCLEINSWSLLVLGIALPLFLLRRRESQQQRRRQHGQGARREQQQPHEPPQQGAASASVGDRSLQRLPHEGDHPPVPQPLRHRQPATHWLLDLYMLSCLAWFALHAALQVWLWVRPPAHNE